MPINVGRSYIVRMLKKKEHYTYDHILLKKKKLVLKHNA